MLLTFHVQCLLKMVRRFHLQPINVQGIPRRTWWLHVTGPRTHFKRMFGNERMVWNFHQIYHIINRNPWIGRRPNWKMCRRWIYQPNWVFHRETILFKHLISSCQNLVNSDDPTMQGENSLQASKVVCGMFNDNGVILITITSTEYCLQRRTHKGWDKKTACTLANDFLSYSSRMKLV